MSDALRPGPAGDRAPVTRLRAGPQQWSTRVNRVLALLTVCVAGTAVIALLTHVGTNKHGSPSTTPEAGRRPSATTPTATTATTALAQWMRANLPSATPVIADPKATGLLRGAGNAGATNDLTTCRAGTLILLTPSMKQRAKQDAKLAGCISKSVTIATAGTEQVREVATDLPAALRARAAALAVQQRGGAAIAKNPSITIPANLHAAVLAGQLDLRVEAVLTALSSHMHLRLLSIDYVAAEAHAGMPARIVQIAVPTPADVEPRLRMIAAGYRPWQVEQVGPNSLRLSWPFRINPPPILN